MAKRKLVKAVGCLYFSTETRRYLFLMRDDTKYTNTWGLVGGKMEQHESEIAALVRESKEEIGFVPIISKFVPIEKFTSEDRLFEFHTYVCPVDREFIPLLNNEHKGYCWTLIDAYPKPLHPGVYSTFNFDEFKEKIKTIESL
jgi:8-oxo-dGTP pyrophosphatase MutT (NUDIX family)